MRVLTPRTLREEDGPDAIAGRYAQWLGARAVLAPRRRRGDRRRPRPGPLPVPRARPRQGLAGERAHRLRDRRRRADHGAERLLRRVPAGGAALTDVGAAWEPLLAAEEVVHRATEPPRPGRTEPMPARARRRGRRARSARRGIVSLWSHQAETWETVAAGGHAIVTTGTASGKSLAFSLPVLDALARDAHARALLLFPTKALAQDQARSLAALRSPGVRVGIYDGDTPTEQRRDIRRSANVLLTNPDMLHVGVLPHHDRWGDVLHNLRFVVVDEAHVYRGVFGSHVGNVLRRLRRLASAYGAEPQLLLASATIANPGELARALTGLDVRVVDVDTAPRPEREIVLWNPPLVDPDLGTRASALAEASRVMAELVERGLRTICFAKSRKAAELIHRFTAERVGRETARRLAPYRAGLHAGAAPRDRAPTGRGRAARRLGDRRARAGHRRRRARLRDLGRLPRHGRVAAPAVGPRRPAHPRPRGARRRRGRARPVLHARARGAARTQRRGGDPRPGQPADPRPARPRGRVRGPDHRRGRRDPRGGGASRARRPIPSSRARLPGCVWQGRDHPAARISLRSGDAEAFAVVEEETGALLGLVERERALLDRARGRGLPPPRRAVPRDRARRGVARRARASRRGRLVHAGAQGDRHDDRGGAAHARAWPASSSPSGG